MDEEGDGYDNGDLAPPAKHLSPGSSFYLMDGSIKNTLKPWHRSPQAFQETIIL